ncbi:unnamed protein product [Ophioblennius macclurei]
MIRLKNTQYFHFLQHANVLRSSGSLCDAIISVKSQIFRAHRLVLACASRALAQRLAQGDADSPVHCTLEYFSPRTFQQVLDFTYTQALDVSVEDLRQLLQAAQLLEMQQLEEQCRKQLDTLDGDGGGGGGGGGGGETRDVKEERESGEERNHEEKMRESPPPEDEESVSIVTKTLLLSHSQKKQSVPSSVVKKSRLSPIPALCRDSVIARPLGGGGGGSSFSSPWTLSANVRDSVSTVRRLTENIISAHPLQYAHPSSSSSLAAAAAAAAAAVSPFSFPSPHMFPLLAPHFQGPVQRYMMDCSSLHPLYAQSLYAESAKTTGGGGGGEVLKHSLPKRKQPAHRALGGNAQSDKPSVSVTSHGVSDANARYHPARPESASSQSGKRCAGCQLCGGRDALQPEPETRRNHRGEKSYQCRHCPKKFSLKHQLDTHHRVHTGEKPFECRLCGQRSRDYSAMIKHLRTHNGAAPYQCTVCLEFCSSQVAMQRHVQSHPAQDFPPNWNISSTYLYISHV